jgi:hypothetical protein
MFKCSKLCFWMFKTMFLDVQNYVFNVQNYVSPSLQHSPSLVYKARKKYLKKYLKNIYIKKATSRIFFLFFFYNSN